LPTYRMDKIIAEMTGLSRKEARSLLREGRVRSGERVLSDPGERLDPAAVPVELDGRPLRFSAQVYYLLNKPAGLLSASRDRNRRTVVDLVEEAAGRRGLFPVGRLDKDTTGLLLITNDGDFAHRVISPKSHVEKAYVARLDAPVPANAAANFAAGVTLADGQVCAPARLDLLGEDGCLCRLILCEGKYHQVKRMFGTVGCGVVTLHRERIGRLTLPDGLAEGDFLELDGPTAALALHPREDG
jgi:16S rRNA pseudouridine516 synthase